jgi:hypothetical protein
VIRCTIITFKLLMTVSNDYQPCRRVRYGNAR